jgi:UDP-glucose 4-epimerase
MSMLIVEKFLIDMGRHKKLNSVILRYFNVAGSDPNGEIGENHEPETHLIPNLVRAYLDGKNIDFNLFGTDHPTKDGTCIRDYIHVCDLTKGHLKALEYLQNNDGSFQFNLGSGTGSSVLEVIQAFDKVTNSKLDYKVCPARAGDPPELTADIFLAKKELDFSNEYNLEDCISHCLNYFSNKKKEKIAT